MTTYNVLGKNWRCRKCQKRLLQVQASFRSTGVSWSRQSFWHCVTIGVPYVATWFSGCKQLLSRDIVFSCRDSALCLCRDNVTIEVSMS